MFARASQPMDPSREAPVDPGWVDVCSVSDIVPGTGVAAQIGGQQIAIFRIRSGDAFHALSNFDPFSKAFVLSRGIVGDRGGVPKVASPMYKQNFDLRTGQCLDDPSTALPVYPVCVAGGRVFVRVESPR